MSKIALKTLRRTIHANIDDYKVSYREICPNTERLPNSIQANTIFSIFFPWTLILQLHIKLSPELGFDIRPFLYVDGFLSSEATQDDEDFYNI